MATTREQQAGRWLRDAKARGRRTVYGRTRLVIDFENDDPQTGNLRWSVWVIAGEQLAMYVGRDEAKQSILQWMEANHI